METYRIISPHGRDIEFEAADDSTALQTFEEVRLYRRTFLGWVPIAVAHPRLTADARVAGEGEA